MDPVTGANMSSEEKIELLINRTRNSDAELRIIHQETDHFFLIVMSVVIFFMQCGFSFLEAGSVR